jgi:hypothetical protein
MALAAVVCHTSYSIPTDLDAITPLPKEDNTIRLQNNPLIFFHQQACQRFQLLPANH